MNARVRSRTVDLFFVMVLGWLAIQSGTSGCLAEEAPIRAPRGESRALVIGVDAYGFLPHLKGAVADAADIDQTLRRHGVTDVTIFTDATAERAAILAAFEGLLGRSRPGDLVLISFAGFGSQESSRFGSQESFLLAGFDPNTGAGSRQRILAAEFNHLIRRFEQSGAGVLFIADASHGGATARALDPRAAVVSYRQAPAYLLAVDDLAPISSPADALPGTADFNDATVLAAADAETKVPEIRIPGVPGWRGALSYAVARALDGAADDNHDGLTTRAELVKYVREAAYQLSDQRQRVAARGPLRGDAGSDVLFMRPGATAGSGTFGPPGRPAVGSDATLAAAATQLEPVRLAILGDQRSRSIRVGRAETQIDTVAPDENPDLIWDPESREVIAGGDVIARGMDAPDVAGAVDRTAAVNGFKRLATGRPQGLRVLPDDKVHHRDARVEIEVTDVAQRFLLLFNIAGDGTVQTLYPERSDPPSIADPDFHFWLRVAEPFGADQVIALTSDERLEDIGEALKQMSRRRAALQAFRMIERYAPTTARIGIAGLYTAP